MKDELIANEPAARTAGGESAKGASHQYLSFFLGGQEYATDILRVQEIKGWDTVTRVPYSPNYILGVINLRGAIVPVLDPRVRFGLESAPFNSATVVIVVRVAGVRGERIVGLVVDAVSDVYSFAAENIQAPPDAVGSVDQMFVLGLAKLEDKLVIILDIERLVISSVLGDAKAA
ncbi:MAG: purine-binding chemotaxis protein CheW [Gammaproteobacteria bacterium]|jgi:purine-binding chemotaxis protein CheW|nr:purine-binding chemotaxis protein CheW [Gammaproteobacteria bacterium]